MLVECGLELKLRSKAVRYDFLLLLALLVELVLVLVVVVGREALATLVELLRALDAYWL